LNFINDLDPNRKKTNQNTVNPFTAAFQSPSQTQPQAPPPQQQFLNGYQQNQNLMGFQQNNSNFYPYQNPMNAPPNQPIPPNMNYNQSYGYNQPNAGFGGFYNNQQMNMGMSNQMMGQGFPMQQPMIPPQNYGFGTYQNYQMNVPAQQPLGFNPNMYGTQQDPMGYGGGFGDGFQPMYENTSSMSQPFDNNFYSEKELSNPGDPHPSVFKNQNPQPKAKIQKDSSNHQMRVGSWDPKFLQKGKIKKYQHNNGQGYMQGQISNCQNMKKSGGYSKVKRDKKKKQKNPPDFNNQNIFSQTFGGEIDEEQKPWGVSIQKQVPFVSLQGPPKTAKFDNFNQNLPKSKKSSDNFNQLNPSAFTNQSFAGTYNMEGPLKSSRVPKNEDIPIDSSKCRLKKARSSNDNELMHDQSNMSLPISKYSQKQNIVDNL